MLETFSPVNFPGLQNTNRSTYPEMPVDPVGQWMLRYWQMTNQL